MTVWACSSVNAVRMKFHSSLVVVVFVLGFLAGVVDAQAKEEVERGAVVFRQCAACHSLESGQHLTGPSLATIWGRKAGTVVGFDRYSEALKRSDLIWTHETLDRWLKDPHALVPGTSMTFGGMRNSKDRGDLVAYLKALNAGEVAVAERPGGGMMGAPKRVDLKTLGKEHRVQTIRYCKDTYDVLTESGGTQLYWEFNLRFKTDSSQQGPPKGHPIVVPAGMMGDRASVVFSSPEEISAFIRRECTR